MTYNPFPLIVDGQAARVCFLLFYSLLLALRSMLCAKSFGDPMMNLSERMKKLNPYVPGEQPQDRQYLKLNTNENPYPPSPQVKELMGNLDADRLRLYPDPLAIKLREKIGTVWIDQRAGLCEQWFG